MADDFQAGVCGGTWWNLTGNAAFRSSVCSSEMASFGWPAHMMDMKTTRSSDESAGTSEGSIICGGAMDSSTMEMLGSGLSSSITTTDWNQTLINKGNNNYQSIIQEDMNSSNFQTIDEEDSSSNAFKQDMMMNQGFPLSSTPYSYTSSLVLQSLLANDFQQEESMFGKGSMDDHYQSTNRKSLNEFSSSSSSSSSSCLPMLSSSLKSSLPKLPPLSNFHFTNNTPFWNATATNNVRASFCTTPRSQFIQHTIGNKPNSHKLNAKPNNERVRGLNSVVKKCSSGEPSLKRPRMETPSPLPTFKVRKEKLGDRITALQQLVSPFGKTDTASVLQEAIEYIKLLHDQVNVLSTPYIKIGVPTQRKETLKKSEGTEAESSRDLRTRGLCLVPISSTFPVATETSVDFWTPTFR